MTRQKPPVTTILDMLLALSPADRMSAACVEHWPPDEPRVVQQYDDGKGHSGAVSTTYIPVAMGVYEQAKQLGYITGFLKPGYVSRNEFNLAQAGINILNDHYDKMSRIREQEAAAAHIPEANND